jgi:hypothetical protein
VVTYVGSDADFALARGRIGRALALTQGNMTSIPTIVMVTLALALALVLALALAYLPMRLLMGQMARNVRQFIQRQRDRRRVARETPDRRHL